MISSAPKSMAILALFFLTACGVTNPDSGTPSTLSGIAVDGYVAGATVYLDINGNGQLDSYEPRAITDSQGHFGIAADNTNYCTSSTPSDAQYCLNTGEYSGSAIRIEGGVDTLTGQPFHGVLTRTADATTAQITSPLTSLLSLMNSTQVSSFLSAENTAAGISLTTADLNSDPLSISTTTSAAQDHLIRTAWLVHNAVTIIATELKRHYTSATVANQSLPSDFSPYVYQALVSAWNAAGTPDMQSFLASSTNITDLIGNSSYGAEALIQADGGVFDSGTLATDIPARISDLISLINNAAIFPEGSTGALTQTEVEARGRAIGVLTIMLSQATLSGNEAAAITDLTTSATLTNLANSAADVAQIAADYIASGSANTDYSTRPTLSTALSNAGATSTTPVTLTNGSGGSAALTVDSSAGTVNIDISSVDVNNDGTPDNVSMTGTITPINDYTSVMTVDVMGSQQTVILTTDASGNLVIDTSTMNLDNANVGNFTL